MIFRSKVEEAPLFRKTRKNDIALENILKIKMTVSKAESLNNRKTKQ